MSKQNDSVTPYQLVNLRNLGTQVPNNSILSQTIYASGDMKAILFTFAAEQELSEHTSSYPAVLHFLSGEARVTLGDDEITAEPGTWVYMEPRLPHSIYAKTSVVMLLEMLPHK